VIAAKEFGIDYPSKLPVSFIRGHGAVYLHAMHSVVDWFAFAQWNNGHLVRSISLSPDSGILEDIGERLSFEEPFWSGQHPAVDGEDEYPFQFHPLELGEAALKEFFGYQLEGPIDRSLLEPECVPLIKYKRSRSRWKILVKSSNSRRCFDLRIGQKSSITDYEGEPRLGINNLQDSWPVFVRILYRRYQCVQPNSLSAL